MTTAAGTLDPVRFADWLGHGVTPDLLCRVLAVPRLDSACRRLLDRRIGIVPEQLTSATATALTLDGLALLSLAQQAGAVWHGRAILQIIDGAEVRALVDAIGPGLRLAAIRHADLAGGIPATGSGIDGPLDPARLAGAIASDGAGCLAAWCAAQPLAVGVRLLLRLPPFPAAVGAAHHAYGPAIIGALLDETA